MIFSLALTTLAAVFRSTCPTFNVHGMINDDVIRHIHIYLRLYNIFLEIDIYITYTKRNRYYNSKKYIYSSNYNK